MSDFVPTWLYVKQHNKTGLKYFGKHTGPDPVLYKGSGLYWRRHLKIHGPEVTTTWCELFTDRTQLMEYALRFSKENNISNSTDWANIKPENGLDGNPFGMLVSEDTKKKQSASHKGIPKSSEHKAKLKAARNLREPISEETRQRMSKSRTGMKLTDEHRKNLSLSHKGQVAWNKGIPKSKEECLEISNRQLGSLNPMFGKTHTKEAREKIGAARRGKSPSNKGVSPPGFTCQFCGKVVPKGALTRFHNDRCKDKK